MARKIALTVAGVCLLFGSAPARPQDPIPASTMLEPPNAASQKASDWLAAHYPAMMTQTQLQQAYDTLIRGYAVPQTGLFLSFPGTTDKALRQQAATYDQGVVGVLLLALGDTANAGKIVHFYSIAWERLKNRSGPRQGHEGLANFYNAFYEVEGIEKTMHVGPNAWIGLLASRYYQQTGDPEALQLAETIARWILYRVPHSDGVVAMGEIPWNSTQWNRIFSTENNESTYAFLSDLRRVPTLDPALRRDCETECSRIRHWLLATAYDRKTGKVLRGFHPAGQDRIGAIDSYTWFLGALRPNVVRANGVSVPELIRRATSDFVVHVGNRWGIDPVDGEMAQATYHDDYFNRRMNDPLYLRPIEKRHPVIWYEGTGQYLVALQDAAVDEARNAFRQNKESERQAGLARAQAWLSKARLGAHWMDAAAVQYPWGKTYPCATDGRFYLYGWPAPRGEQARPSDAVAALVWRMFVGMSYEPLSGNFLNPALHPHVVAQIKPQHDPGTDLLLGASEEMMVRAWELYDQKKPELAWRQAQATIDLWQRDAKWLQNKKREVDGGYIVYDGKMEQFQRIHNYWALNDVCASYFIQGKIADERGDVETAHEKFATILKEYSLAQIWDKRGWFWDPVDAIQMDYAAAASGQYASLYDLLPGETGTEALPKPHR